jgi:uncharacterized membrane protein (UPF0127 family)
MTFKNSYRISILDIKIIPESGINFMRKLLTLTLLFILFGCQSESRKTGSIERAVELITPAGDSIKTTLAIDPKEQEQGLSGVKPEDYEDNQGMLFYYTDDGEKNFWMPDTYFDLDLFYLDKDLKILDIVRKLPFYVGRANSKLIPRARGVWCRHTLEMKSTSEIAQRLKIGDVLKWKGSVSLEETDALVRKQYSLK